MVSEKGHYAGRTQPSNTRQGIYALAPSGEFLASINSNDPRRMADMMRTALVKWRDLAPEKRRMADGIEGQTAQVRRPEDRYPADGLALRVYSRDLPRPSQPPDWRAQAWNQDFAWFTKQQMTAFVPASGAIEVPSPLVRRLARLNFVDNVRGQTGPFSEPELTAAKLTATLVSKQGDVSTIRYEGETLAERTGVWPINGFRDAANPTPQRLGMRTKLYGIGLFDASQQKFLSFRMVAAGVRWGGTQYNGRQDDLGEGPIGFAITLAGSKPADKVAPAFWWEYR